jgi:GxxExxY protein
MEIDDPLTYKIIGCAMTVHRVLGSGFPEIIYQRSLAIELEKANIDFEQEISKTVYYDNKVVGKRRADFIVEEDILIEIKSRAALEPTHFAQIKNYLTAYHLEIGLLINFGEQSLVYKRIYHPRLRGHKNLNAPIPPPISEP